MHNEENDWIIENIRVHLKVQSTKMETISRELGISQGEFSKILNGQRKDYFKYLPKLAHCLNISFHQLVNPSHSITNNYNGNNSEKELYERLISECKEKDKAKDELLVVEREAKEDYKRKYQDCKSRLESLEKNRS